MSDDLRAEADTLRIEDGSRWRPNPERAGRRGYPSACRRIVSVEGAEAAARTMDEWLGGGATPLRDLTELAADLGVGRILAKDESGRFGLNSFKALGGAYAVTGVAEEAQDAADAELTVCAATAGNHGRAVAWGARKVGCPCVIYVPVSTDARKVEAIARLGARIVEVEGTYDDAVDRAAREAEEHGWQVVSDTAYPGYREIPALVMQGYGVLAREVVSGWPEADPPTHAFLQCGVGGLAAAVCAHFWEHWGAARPRCVVVEPAAAPCMFLSSQAGRPVEVEGEMDTEMLCLACARPSLLAWEILRQGADDFLLVADREARAAAKRLAEGRREDPAIRTTATGAAGVAGLMQATSEEALRKGLRLSARSRVLVVVSEGR